VTNVLSARLRHINTKLMISAELLDVIDGWHLWGDAFSCDAHGLAEVQEQIAKKISDALKLKLTVDERERLAKRYTENSEAYLHYLRGRHHWAKYTKQGLETAIKCYRQAIELDPTYALAYVGIADAYFRLSTTFLPPLKTLPKAKAAAQKALEIDDQLAEAHASLGKINLHLRQWDTAEAELRKAIELKKGYAPAHLSLGALQGFRGNFQECVMQKKTALQLDPLSLQINVSLATTLWGMSNYEAAKRQLLETLAMDENFQPAYIVLAFVQEQQGDYVTAIETFEKAVSIGETSFLIGFLARVYALHGDKQAAYALINKSISEAQTRYISPYSIALAFVGLGDLDSAFGWFETAYETYDEWLLFLRKDRRLDVLRADPRLHDLMRRVGLA
jgi:tetratricopeptide (TPR) repeat protein